MKLLTGLGLMVLCVAIHAAGLTAALGWLRQRRFGVAPQTFWGTTWLLSVVAGWAVLLHLVQIACWALVFGLRGALPDLQAAFYFSAVTFTTTGYGDLVLPEAWRLVGGIEALTGIILCGWSTAFFFAVVVRLNEHRPGLAGLPERPGDPR